MIVLLFYSSPLTSRPANNEISSRLQYKGTAHISSLSFHKWRAVDDGVRGGSSVSHLTPVKIDVQGQVTGAPELEESRDVFGEKRHNKGDKNMTARFWGNLGESVLLSYAGH